MNLFTTATLGTEESGHCREVAAVESLKQGWMYGLSAKKNGRCREVAVSGSSTVLNECNKMGRTSSADFANFWVRKWEFLSSRLNMEQKKQRVLFLKKSMVSARIELATFCV